MSKALRIISMVASIAALIPGPQQPFVQAVAVIAGIGAAITAKKPPAQGSTNQIQIGANMPMPYVIGRSYVGGNLVHDVAYGGTVNDVPNPYRSMVIVGSVGPIEEFEAFQSDFTTIAFSGGNAVGYYENFMRLASQLGETPEASALAGPYGAIPQWGASYKLSGLAAWMVSLKFDKKGKVFASGVPQVGAILKGVKGYDARLDDTYDGGGAGDHRFDDESTFEYTENPAIHATTYARGRFQGDDDTQVIGCGLSQDQIDWPAWVAFANVCDANGWKVGGTIYEAPGASKWDNLKRICAAGAAEPVDVGGLLSVRYSAPKIALDTITADDLADGEASVPAMKSWRDRKNGIIPRYRSPDHKWEYVQSEDLVTVEDYVTEDGEEKNEEVQYDFVTDIDQAAQLAAYDLVDGREIDGIVLPCKPRLLLFRPGEAVEVDIPELGLVGRLCVITGWSFDPGTGIVTLTLMTETTAKHAFALGQTGTAPPTPTIISGEEQDEAVFGVVPSAPEDADWDAVGTSLASAGGEIPAIVITGAVPDTDGLLGIQFDYRVAGGFLTQEIAGWLLLEDGSQIMLEDQAPGPWIGAMLDGPDTIEKQIVSVTPGTQYEASIQYMNRAGLSDRLILGPITVGVLVPAESISIAGVYDQAKLDEFEARITALE